MQTVEIKNLKRLSVEAVEPMIKFLIKEGFSVEYDLCEDNIKGLKSNDVVIKGESK